MLKPLRKELLWLSVFAAAFVIASLLAHRYRGELSFVVGQGGFASIVGFILLTAVFVVFVIPLDIAVLIPLGAHIWGPAPTAVMSIIGWTLGAAAAFYIARRFGAGMVERLIGLERVRALEKRIPKRHLFWMVALWRMCVSVDILSYALGLFSSMNWGVYIAATALGVTPFGFFFAYAGTLPLFYQLLAVALALASATVTALWFGVREP